MLFGSDTDGCPKNTGEYNRDNPRLQPGILDSRGNLDAREMDSLSAAQRSAVMSRIRGRDTGPELAVRSLVHGLGYRFRLHRSDLPGSPDLVFPGRRKVIFVHGCFWHQHQGCPYAYRPKSHVEFWREKFARNKSRDQRALRKLRLRGWDPIVVWECEGADPRRLAARLRSFLEGRIGKR